MCSLEVMSIMTLIAREWSGEKQSCHGSWLQKTMEVEVDYTRLSGREYLTLYQRRLSASGMSEIVRATGHLLLGRVLSNEG